MIYHTQISTDNMVFWQHVDAINKDMFNRGRLCTPCSWPRVVVCNAISVPLSLTESDCLGNTIILHTTDHLSSGFHIQGDMSGIIYSDQPTVTGIRQLFCLSVLHTGPSFAHRTKFCTLHLKLDHTCPAHYRGRIWASFAGPFIKKRSS